MEIDYNKLYEDLKLKLEAELPFTAYPLRELIQKLRESNIILTLKTKVTITGLHNSGDISGIVCTIESTENDKKRFGLWINSFNI